MTGKALTMLAVGDMILRMPDNAESYFALVAPMLKSGDVVVGQGAEIPFTARGVSTFVKSSFGSRPTLACDPKNMSALPFAGFNVITLAGNHIWDAGVPGIEDTIIGLRNYGITFVGAGMNIDEARRPAIIERKGTRFGFLNYNCVGPKETWANPVKPGCAYVNIITHYDLEHPSPGGIPTIYTFAELSSLQEMTNDIHNLRPLCDVLVVAFHKGSALGLVLTGYKLPAYEHQVAYAAIDAGADLILAEHHHSLRGIEQYKGKIIFHGLGDFVKVIPSEDRPAWLVQEQEKMAGGREFGPKSGNLSAASEGDQTIIAKCTIDDRKISRVSYFPCLINKQRQPEILKNDERGQQVFDYVDKITRAAGLNTRYEWEGDEVVIHTE